MSLNYTVDKIADYKNVCNVGDGDARRMNPVTEGLHSMKRVKVHCGSSHVKGKARKYPYFLASLFEAVSGKAGYRWINSGKTTLPRRSQKLAEADGRALAEAHGAEFVKGYGSLHNKPVAEMVKTVVDLTL